MNEEEAKVICENFVKQINYSILAAEMKRAEKKETFNDRYFHKRCVTCDAYGYKTANDWKYGRKYCFEHKIYINKPSEVVCAYWKPTD